MSTETSPKNQNVLWWIASIATSVLCCSILFVLFASYVIELKLSVRDTNERIGIIQEREERILAEIQMIQKRVVFQPAQPTAAIQAPAAATEAPAPLSVDGVNPNKAPETPSVAVPLMPVPSDKK